MGQNEKILRSVYARYPDDGPAAVLPYFDENIVWQSPGAPNRIESAGEWYGRDGTRVFFENLRLNWTLKSMHLQELISEGDRKFVARLLVCAVSNATGKPVSVVKMDYVTMENGKITSYAETYDTALLERASRL